MAVIRYACECCGRMYDTEAEANACQAKHCSIVGISEQRYKKKPEPEKYPSSVVLQMSDGSFIVYYIGRAEQQPATPVEYRSVPYPATTGAAK